MLGGEYFGGQSNTSGTGGGLLDFPLDEPIDGPPWRFAQESAELLDLSIGSLHSPPHTYEESMNQRQSTTTDGGSGSDYYPSSNEHAWLGDY